jgi:TonB family protein
MEIRYKLLVAIFLIAFTGSSGQTAMNVSICNFDSIVALIGEKIILDYEKSPSFPGGIKKLNAFIEKEYKYPRSDVKGGGSLVISFIIDKEGNILNPCIAESSNQDSLLRIAMEKSALSTVTKMPKWIPARKNNVPVPVIYSLTFYQNTYDQNIAQIFGQNPYENGKLVEGYKSGMWEYYDYPGELSLKVNYDKGQLAYLIPDSTEYAVMLNGKWVLSRLDKQPRYIGSMVEFHWIIQANIKYPENAKYNTSSATFYVTFEVDSLGKAGNFIAINDPCDGCGNEAIRVLNLIPNLWIPAEKDGQSLNSRFIVPFNINKNNPVGINTKSESEIVPDSLFPPAKKLEPADIIGFRKWKSDQLNNPFVEKKNTPIIDSSNMVYSTVEVMPKFSGGEDKLFDFLARNIRYPHEAREKGIQGRIYLTFVIDSLGNVSDAKTLRGIGSGCDEEALRVINSMPPWIPGRQDGKPVSVQYNLPVNFSLNEGNEKMVKFKFDASNFNSNVRAKINSIVRNDFGRGKTMDYNIGDNWVSIIFSVNADGKGGNFRPLSAWGQQFVGDISSSIKNLMTFYPEEKTMYFHLNIHLTESKVYNMSFGFSENMHHP